MNNLLRNQIEFSHKLRKLLNYAEENEIFVTIGSVITEDMIVKEDIYVDVKRNFNNLRLSIDIIALVEDLRSCVNYNPKFMPPYFKLGKFWETIGGVWGGRIGNYSHFYIEKEC